MFPFIFFILGWGLSGNVLFASPKIGTPLYSTLRARTQTKTLFTDWIIKQRNILLYEMGQDFLDRQYSAVTKFGNLNIIVVEIYFTLIFI